MIARYISENQIQLATEQDYTKIKVGGRVYAGEITDEMLIELCGFLPVIADEIPTVAENEYVVANYELTADHIITHYTIQEVTNIEL